MSWLDFVSPYLPNAPYNYDKLVLPEGPEDTTLAFVGEAPGEDEIFWKPSPRPFVGAAGKIFDRMLLETGINRSSCFVTNVSLERPTDNKFKSYFYRLETKPRKRYIPSERLKKWWYCLEKQLTYVNPNVVVALGNEPLQAIMGLWGITKRRGSIYTSKHGFKVVPILHPAAVMRNWKARTVALHDLARAKHEATFRGRIEPNLILHVDPEFGEVIEYLEYIIKEKPEITIDLETLKVKVDPKTKLPLHKPHIACIGIGHTPDAAMIIPLMRSVGHYWKLPREAEIVSRLVKILRDPDIHINGQNFISFDSYIFWLEWGVIPQGIVFDTMHGQHLLYPERFGPNMGLGLEFMTSLYTDPVINYYKDEGKTWERKIGEKQFWRYCGKDVVATRQSKDKVQTMLQKNLWKNSLKTNTSKCSSSNMLHFYNNYTLPLSLCLQELQVTGMLVDKQRQDQLLSNNASVISWMQRVIDEIVKRGTMEDTSSLNVRSPDQMKYLLYDYWNLPRQYKTTVIDGKRTRILTTDENAIVQLKKHAPDLTGFFDFLLRQKELLQEQNFLKTPISPDGRIRTVLSVSGTETGRLNSSKPPCGYGTNLQNVKNRLRQIIIPDPGYELWEGDGSQAEARVVAVLAQQWDLIDLFERGDIDVHWENAKRIFGLKDTLIYSESNSEHYRMRYLAKRVIHASNYGMSWYKFRQLLLTDAGLDMEKKEVETLLETYHRIYPNIRGIFHAGIVRQLRQNRELVNPFGRRRIFYDRWPLKGEGELFRSAYAYLPQSTVVDLINHALLDFWRWSKTTMGRVQVLHQVHDSILYQVRPAYALAAAHKLKELMERTIYYPHYELKIPCDFKKGMNWGKWSKDNEEGLVEYDLAA